MHGDWIKEQKTVFSTDYRLMNIQPGKGIFRKEVIMEDINKDKFKDTVKMQEIISQFLDEELRVKSWPARKDRKLAVLYYISTKFEEGVTYSEKEVNEIITKWHTFGDFFLIRRELIEENLLVRTNNGSRYWKET